MKRMLAAFAAMTLLVSQAHAWSLESMNATIDSSNFIVNEGCSGTLIDIEKRHILTAEHCIGAQYETVDREKIADDGTIKMEKIRKLKPGSVRQLLFSGALQVRETSYRTEVVALDRKRDLAVVRIMAEIPNTLAARVSCKDPVRGEPVFTVGNPMGSLYSSVSTGIVSSVQRTYGTIDFGSDEEQPLMQISSGVVGGNSGGAVFNGSGQIIGVSVIAHRMNEVLGFAAPLADIKTFLRESKLDSALAHCAQ